MPLDPLTHPVHRRALLQGALGSAAIAIAAAGCSRPTLGIGPRAAVVRTPLTVVSSSVLPVATELAAAWATGHPSSQLVVQSQQGPAPGYATSPAYAHADVGEQWGDGLELDGLKPYLPIGQLVRQANFNLANLPPSGVQAFTFGGELFGLPLVSTPFVLLVNGQELTSIGVTHPAGQPWTLAEIESAVAAARASTGVPSSAQLIVGSKWTDIRLWGAFVLGLGGGLTDARGGLDFGGPACVKATELLIGLATAANWSGQANGFVTHTFRGAAHALFAIEPNFPPPPHPIGVSGPENRFPLCPSNPLIPAYTTSGLTVPTHSRNPELALRVHPVAVRGYEANQQRLLMSAGIPPVVTNQPALQIEWSNASGGKRLSSLSDPTHMVDVLGLLPQGGYTAFHDYNSILPGWLVARETKSRSALRPRVWQALGLSAPCY